MKQYMQIIRKNYLVILIGIVFLFMRAACTKIDSVEVPASVQAGQELTMEVHVKIDALADNTSHLVLGLLLPAGWDAGKHTSVSFTSSLGPGNMAVMPVSAKAPNSNNLSWPEALKQKFGVGPNLVEGMEWVVFQSGQTYAVTSGKHLTADITVATKAGMENRLFKIGFFVANSQDGISTGINGQDNYSVFFTDCFSVIDGNGRLLDYCNPQISFAEPISGTGNDIITLVFNNSVVETALSDINNIYLCAKAFTSEGDSIEVCTQTDESKLTAIGGEQYRIDFWPRGYFDVPDDVTLTRMEYYFTDASGSTKIGYGNTSVPFEYNFNCQ